MWRPPPSMLTATLGRSPPAIPAEAPLRDQHTRYEPHRQHGEIRRTRDGCPVHRVEPDAESIDETAHREQADHEVQPSGNTVHRVEDARHDGERDVARVRDG